MDAQLINVQVMAVIQNWPFEPGTLDAESPGEKAIQHLFGDGRTTVEIAYGEQKATVELTLIQARHT